MEQGFYVLVSMRSPRGWIEYARFYLGNQVEAAYATFSNLKGGQDDNEWLRMDFVKFEKQARVRLGRRYCTLDELQENGRLITREVFKRFNLESELTPSRMIAV